MYEDSFPSILAELSVSIFYDISSGSEVVSSGFDLYFLKKLTILSSAYGPPFLSFVQMFTHFLVFWGKSVFPNLSNVDILDQVILWVAKSLARCQQQLWQSEKVHVTAKCLVGDNAEMVENH